MNRKIVRFHRIVHFWILHFTRPSTFSSKTRPVTCMAIKFQGTRPISTFKNVHFWVSSQKWHVLFMEQNNISNFKTWTWYLPLWFFPSGVIRSPFEIIFLDHFRLIFLKFMNFLIQVRSLLKPGLVVPALDIYSISSHTGLPNLRYVIIIM